jgi:hypothetical protein
MQTQKLRWIIVSGMLLICALSCSRDRWNSAVVGTWKGTDEFGHEHYFEFLEDGTLICWDMDRTMEDGVFTKRGPFKGFYKRGRNGQLELSDGFQSLGVLTGGRNELTQDDSGHTMRKRLTYRKVQD